MIFDRSYKRLLYQVVAGTIVFLAIVLVGLLAAASANTEFFDRYFTLLYKVNLVIGVLLVVIIGGLMLALALRARRGKFGTRLMTKLAVFFGVVGVLPGVLIYLVSLQFVSRSIESWFDVKVESALEAGLNLGRTTMDASLAELQNKGRLIAEQLGDGSMSATAITLNRLREQFGVQEATIFTGSGRVVATSSNTYDTLVPEFPSQAVLEQARTPGGYASLEGGSDSAADGEAASAPAARAGGRRSDLYQLRVVLALGTMARDDAALTPHTPVRKWAGSGLLADRRSDDSSTRGFGLIGEAGREALPAAGAAGAAGARAQRRCRAAGLPGIPGEGARPHRPAQDVHRDADADAVPRGVHCGDAGAAARRAAGASAADAAAGHARGGRGRPVAQARAPHARRARPADPAVQPDDAPTGRCAPCRGAESRGARAVEGLSRERPDQPDGRRVRVRSPLGAADRQPRRRADLQAAVWRMGRPVPVRHHAAAGVCRHARACLRRARCECRGRRRGGPLAEAGGDSAGGRGRAPHPAGARHAAAGAVGGRARYGARLRGGVRRHLRRDLGAALGRLGRSGPAARARDQELLTPIQPPPSAWR